MSTAGSELILSLVWRIIVGVSLVPAFGTLYQRLTLPESQAFLKTRGQQDPESEIEDLKKAQAAEEKKAESATTDSNSESETPSTPSPGNTAHFRG